MPYKVMTNFEVTLLVICCVFFVANIALCLSLRGALPLYKIYSDKYYEADNRVEKFSVALGHCKCLRTVFPYGKEGGIKFFKMDAMEDYFESENYEDEYIENSTSDYRAHVKTTTRKPKLNATTKPRRHRGKHRQNIIAEDYGGDEDGSRGINKREASSIMGEFITAVLRKNFLDDDELRFACNSFALNPAIILAKVILLICAFLLVTADIFMMFFIGVNVPLHVIQRGKYYPANDKEVTFAHAASRCACLNRIFASRKKPEYIKFSKISDITQGKPKSQHSQVTTKRPAKSKTKPTKITTSQPRIRRESRNNYHRLIAAVLEQRYYDDHEKIFKCNALIYTTDTILARRNCIKSPSNKRKALYVRAGSHYWSQYGTLHNVINITNYNTDFVALHIHPKIKAISESNKIALRPDNWAQAMSIGWDENLYEKPLDQRSKWQTIDISRWSRNQCSRHTISSTVTLHDGNFKTGKLLFNLCKEFIGFESNSLNHNCNRGLLDNCLRVYDNMCADNLKFQC